MIFYGTNSSRLKTGQLRHVTCPNCENQTSMNYNVFGKYAYLYWVPVFPLSKENMLECNSCKKTFKLKELPEQIQQKFDLEKHRGVPIFHFSGLIVIGLIITWFSYSNSNDKKLEALYIKSPQVGDIYSIESSTNNGYYTTMKIINVTKDSIDYIFNDYEIDKKYKINKIKNNSYNAFIIESISKDYLKILYEEKTIYKIYRD